MGDGGKSSARSGAQGDARRYESVRELGRGGMGAVSLVHDHVRQQNVALKRVLRPDPDALLRFKREFRTVRQKVHPNLVRLYDLGQDEQGPFFTMEALEGVDLFAYCTQEAPALRQTVAANVASGVRRAGNDASSTAFAPTLPGSASSQPVEPERSMKRLEHDPVAARLAIALPQMLAALNFLHAHHIVHRDLKPSNVIVGADGHLKVLDFGVLAEVGVTPSGGPLVGSLGYAAPEQLLGQAPAPSMDLYAIGAILFEIFTGKLPRNASSLLSILHELRTPVPSLAERMPSLPRPITTLVDDLLQTDPASRPTLHDVAEAVVHAFGAERPPMSAPVPASLQTFVGRDDELERIVGHARDPGAHGMLVLEGPTGCGKTALAERAASMLERQGYLVLRGRGRPNERLAFNVLDAALDSLAIALQLPALDAWRESQQQLLATVATIFPVLGTPDAVHHDVGRRDAFDALLAILEALSLGGTYEGVVVFADDLQWADHDSVTLLEHLLDAQASRVTLLSTLRNDIATSPAVQAIVQRPDVRVDCLGPLDEPSIRGIIRRSVADAAVEISERTLDDMVRACDGRPVLAELVGSVLQARDTAHDGSGVSLDGLVARADEQARVLLAILATAEAWVSFDRLERLTAWNPGVLEDRLDDLDRRRLIRRDRAEDGALAGGRADIYHDTIRTALASSLSEAETRGAHQAHADVLLEERDAPAVVLVRHLLGAAREKEASQHALAAARAAQVQKAFSLAADMYAVALRHPPREPLELLRARVSMLENSGRYTEAVSCWREIGETTEAPEERVDARLREAHALLASGRVIEGHTTLQTALRNLPRRPRLGRVSELWSALRFMAGPRRRPTARRATADHADRHGAERDFRIGALVGYFDPIAGIHYLMEALDTYHRLGLAREEAICAYLLSYFAINGSGRPGPEPLADKFKVYGDALASQLSEKDPLVTAIPPLLDGCQAFRAGRFDSARSSFRQVELSLVGAGRSGSFEHLYGLSQTAILEAVAQDFEALGTALNAMRLALRDVPDTALRATLENLTMWRTAFRGELEQAQRAAQKVQSMFPPDMPTIQRMMSDFMGLLPAIYLTDCARLTDVVRESFRRGKRFRPNSTWMTSMMTGLSALVEANALRSRAPGASLRRMEHYARIADRTTVTLPGATWRARAYAADALGRPEECLVYLGRAEEISQSYGQRVDTAIAKYQRGIRIGGDEGADCVARARTLVVEAGSHERLLLEDAGRR